VLVAKLPDPAYFAVIEWPPTVSPAVVRLAWPLALSVPVPSVLGPSRNVTVPAGVPVPGGLTTTVAVKVTACPTTAELGEAVTEVVVEATPIVTLPPAGVPLLPVKLVSPP